MEGAARLSDLALQSSPMNYEIYAFVLGYLSGRTVIALYHRLAGWIG